MEEEGDREINPTLWSVVQDVVNVPCRRLAKAWSLLNSKGMWREEGDEDLPKPELEEEGDPEGQVVED